MSESEDLQSNSFCDGYSVRSRMKSGSHIWDRGRPDETRAFFALSTLRGVGQKTLFALAESGRSFSDVVEQGLTTEPIDSRPPARHDVPVSVTRWATSRSDALRRGDELAAMLERLGVRLLLRGDPRFPQQLLDLPRPPHWLFVQGAMSPLKGPAVAIVGTRNPSADVLGARTGTASGVFNGPVHDDVGEICPSPCLFGEC
jgi:predicted Rossmann fold nucleotide-binding protein DprA/Smf involved in DNA uptake